MRNFMWLDIDSSLQANDSKWLDSFCDSPLTRLDQVMTRFWLEKILDDSKSTRRVCDSDSTKMTRAYHWWSVAEMSGVTFFRLCWVRLGSSTWNVLWFWNTNKGRLQKQVQKTTWEFSANVIEQHRQRRSIRQPMLKVASPNGLNSRRIKLEQSNN